MQHSTTAVLIDAIRRDIRQEAAAAELVSLPFHS